MMTESKVTPALVKELRERTGVGMGKCKEALDQVGGDMEKAIDLLRKSGMASAVKKEGRETREGVIGFAETPSSIALIEVNSETDFVAQNDKFKLFVKEVAEEAARSNPPSLEVFLTQKFSKDPSVTIDQYRALVIQSLGENIQIKRIEVFKKGAGHSFGIYSHMGGKIVTVVELTGSSGFDSFAKEIAMHVAAESPEYLEPKEIPQEVIAREKEIAAGQIAGKPANMAEKIIEGKVKAFYDQVCLLGQKFVKDPSVTVEQFVANEAKKVSKPISILRFIRWKMGG